MQERRTDEAQRAFEVAFFEGVLGRWPDCPEALSVLGTLYTRMGRLEEGLSVDSRLAALRPDDPVAHYNVACSLALLGRKGDAFSALERSVAVGYRDVVHMDSDPDLSALRGEARYDRIKRAAMRAAGP